MAATGGLGRERESRPVPVLVLASLVALVLATISAGCFEAHRATGTEPLTEAGSDGMMLDVGTARDADAGTGDRQPGDAIVECPDRPAIEAASCRDLAEECQADNPFFYMLGESFTNPDGELATTYHALRTDAEYILNQAEVEGLAVLGERGSGRDRVHHTVTIFAPGGLERGMIARGVSRSPNGQTYFSLGNDARTCNESLSDFEVREWEMVDGELKHFLVTFDHICPLAGELTQGCIRWTAEE